MYRIVEDKNPKRYSLLHILISLSIMFLIPVFYLLIWIVIASYLDYRLSETAENIMSITLVAVLISCMWIAVSLPDFYAKKIPDKLRSINFKCSYSFKCHEDYLYIDKQNCRIALVTHQNPSVIQIFRADSFKDFSTCLKKNIRKDKVCLIRLKMTIKDKDFYIDTFNGMGGRTTQYIKLDSYAAELYMHQSQEIENLINKLKSGVDMYS